MKAIKLISKEVELTPELKSSLFDLAHLSDIQTTKDELQSLLDYYLLNQEMDTVEERETKYWAMKQVQKVLTHLNIVEVA